MRLKKAEWKALESELKFRAMQLAQAIALAVVALHKKPKSRRECKVKRWPSSRKA